MKKIILEPVEQKQILLNDLMGREIVAYRCRDSNSVCVLSQVVRQGQKAYGFINLSYPMSQPTFCSHTFYEAIKTAINTRDVRVFTNQDDLIKAIYTNLI